MKRALRILTLLASIAALITACDSEGGGVYDPNENTSTTLNPGTATPPSNVDSQPTDPENCWKSAPAGAECNPYCGGAGSPDIEPCDASQHCSHDASSISCMSYGSLSTGEACDSSIFCEPRSACLSMGTAQKTCFRFCQDDQDCGASGACSLQAWVEIGFGGEFLTFCDPNAGGDITDPDETGDPGDDEDDEWVEQPCSPDCWSKECGPDGCGGVCGECPANGECVSGQCAAPEPCTGGIGTACGSNSNCSEGLFCGGWGVCASACSFDWECAEGICFGPALGIEGECLRLCADACCEATYCNENWLESGLPGICVQ